MTPRVVPQLQRRPYSSLDAHRGDSGKREDRAFWNYATHGSVDGADVIEFLDEDERLALEEHRVLSKATSGGGFLVPTDVAQAVTSAARATSPLALLAQEFVTATGDQLNVSLGSTHGSAAWTAESASYTPSDETITSQALQAFKATSKILVSEELMTDSAVALDQYLANELGSRLGALESAAMATGDGSGKPLGVVNASSTYSVTTASAGSTLKYTPADLLAALKALPAAYRAGAVWLMHPDDIATLAGLTDTAGAYAIPSLQFSPQSLMGLPIFGWADLPTPAVSAKSAVLGRWDLAYGVRRVQGLGLQRQNEIASDSGQIGFRSFERVDGRILLSAAAVILAHSAT